MATTPNYALRYPDPSMPANVPADIQNLANDVDSVLHTQLTSLLQRVSTLESELASFPVADPGDFRLSARATPSAGWLLCDGSAVSRTTYSTLFQAIGIKYGPGDGSTTFNLPDFPGRTFVMVGPHADVNDRGKSDGLAPGNRRPKHKHTVNDPTHTHGGSFFRDQMGNTGHSTYDLAGGNDLMTAIPNAPIGVTVGPQTGAEPVDGPAFLTGNVFIKT